MKSVQVSHTNTMFHVHIDPIATLADWRGTYVTLNRLRQWGPLNTCLPPRFRCNRTQLFHPYSEQDKFQSGTKERGNTHKRHVRCMYIAPSTIVLSLSSARHLTLSCAASTVIPLLFKATFTTSIQNLGLILFYWPTLLALFLSSTGLSSFFLLVIILGLGSVDW